MERYSLDELAALLARFNPWWAGGSTEDVPVFERPVLQDLFEWAVNPSVKDGADRVAVLVGARQTGRSTLMRQLIRRLLDDGVPAENILFVPMSHPVFRLAQRQSIDKAWQKAVRHAPGMEHVFVDEAHIDWSGMDLRCADACFYASSLQTWSGSFRDCSHGTGEDKPAVPRKVVVTMTHVSGDKRADPNTFSSLQTLNVFRIEPLSFREYLQIRGVPPGPVQALSSLFDLFAWSGEQFARCSETAKRLNGHFRGYLLQGGFPRAALAGSVAEAQRILREEVLDRALKRDMSVLAEIRGLDEIEELFYQLCLNEGKQTDSEEMRCRIRVAEKTAARYLGMLEAAYLIRHLGKNDSRPEAEPSWRLRQAVCLTDPALSSALLGRGEELFEDWPALERVVESAVCRHCAGRTSLLAESSIAADCGISLSADDVSGGNGEGERILCGRPYSSSTPVPFPVRCRAARTDESMVPGLLAFMRERGIARAFVVTWEPDDFGPMALSQPDLSVMRIPASLFCYWLGRPNRA
ncbi:MAG: AAA family ATPase [Desulfovibrionaceae bacterium]|nr:AAA family ATPase [Desulfovibrionaceae bacterium]